MKNIFLPILGVSLSALMGCSFVGSDEVNSTNNNLVQVESVNSIEINTNDTDVNILKSDDNKIEYNPDFFAEGENLICENKDGKLILTCLKKKKSDTYRNPSCVNIFINPNNVLNDCKINMNVGNLKVSDGIDFGKGLEVVCNVGNIELLTCNLLDSALSVGTGNLKVSGELSGENKVSVNTGNAVLHILNKEKKLSDINYKLTTNVGKIFIDGNSAFKKNSSSPLTIGYQLSNNAESDTKLNVNVGVGNISVNSKDFKIED